MSSQQYQTELSLFNKEVHDKNPEDFLQFASNYFNRRLEQQRLFIKNQASLVLSKGIVLFPTSTSYDSTTASHSALGDKQQKSKSLNDHDILFKSPFVEQDPHSSHIVHEDLNSVENVFKGNFSISTAQKNINDNHLDTMAPDMILPQQKLPRRSIVNPTPLPINFNAERRTSVSGETFQPDNFNNWVPKGSTKTVEQLSRLEISIGQSFLFNKLDSDSKKLVIDSLQERSVPENSKIINQGDEGDYFYIVESGTVDFYVNDQKVNTSGPGSSFGELALMYNSPRAATVVASTDCILWSLDRLTFRKILLGGSFKKRIMYDDLLKSMPVFQSLTTYDRAKLADALDTEYYEPGSVIIKEGDLGENFYFIEYGTADITKEGQGLIATLKKGDYFGEIALLNDLPRQATVTTTTPTKVATLGKSGFQRLLGPAVKILKSNDPTRTNR